MSYVRTKRSNKLTELTAEWYQRLKREGFQDIEWYDEYTGYGQNSDFLKQDSRQSAQSFKPETLEYYRIITNFTTHYKFKSRKHAFIMQKYAEGMPYRKILTATRLECYDWVIKRNGRPRLSLFTLHGMIHKYIKLAYEWNKTDPEGLDYDAPASVETEQSED